jgi:hypothetical protein
MIIKPRTLKVKARFRTARERESFHKVSSIFFQAKELNGKNELQRIYLPKVRNVVASAPGVPGISTSQEQKEELVVQCPNTIHNPYTMMIHLKHTSSTNRTVMAPRWL